MALADDRLRLHLEGARDEAPQPGAEAEVDEAFHHDLAGERAGERRVDAGRRRAVVKETQAAHDASVLTATASVTRRTPKS